MGHNRRVYYAHPSQRLCICIPPNYRCTNHFGPTSFQHALELAQELNSRLADNVLGRYYVQNEETGETFDPETAYPVTEN